MNDTIAPAIMNGQYATVAALDVSFPHQVMPLDDFLAAIRDAESVVRKLTAIHPNKAIVVEMSNGLTIKAIVLAKGQGSLFSSSGGDADDAEADNPGDQLPAAPPGMEANSAALDASAMAGTEHIAHAMRQISLRDIAVGETLVRRAEREPLSVECLAQTIPPNANLGIVRSTYALARNHPECDIRFLSSVRTIGGEKKISAVAHSEATFALRRCIVTKMETNYQYQLRGEGDDPEWQRLRSKFSAPSRLKVSKDWPDGSFISEAALRGCPIELVVCVGNAVATGDSFFVPLKVVNYDEIAQTATAHAELLQTRAAERKLIEECMTSTQISSDWPC